MAVDQAKYMNFFTQINNNNNNQFYVTNNDSYQPMIYDVNNVVYHQLAGKTVTPAVKADSGITFNNNLVPPQASRKRTRDQISCVSPNTMTTISTPSSSINVVGKDNMGSFEFLGEALSLQIMQQQLELDRLISHHMEKMKVEIEGRKKQQLMRIMGTMEESLGRKLREKTEEITKIGRINFVLEEKVKSLYLENQIWRDLAQSNEATANALRSNLENVLQQMKDECIIAAEVADDVTSCCGSNGYEDGTGESSSHVQESVKKQNGWIYRGKNGVNSNNNTNNNGRLCKKCGEGESSVLLLPCRHLCLCTTCGPVVNSCPICDTVKTASVHVNLS